MKVVGNCKTLYALVTFASESEAKIYETLVFSAKFFAEGIGSETDIPITVTFLFLNSW